MKSIHLRGSLLYGVALTLLATGTDSTYRASLAEGTLSQSLDRAAFASPPRNLAPMVRWWWPGSDVAAVEIDRELALIASAGFSGFELQSFSVGLPETAPGRDPGYGSAEWFDAVAQAMETARDLGLSAEMTLGSSWPTGGDHISDDLSLQQLTVTGLFVQGPTHLDRELPSPQEPLYYHLAESLLSLPNTFVPSKMSPVAVIAARVDSNQAQEFPPAESTLPGLPELPATIYLDPGSVVFLSDRLTPSGRLMWDVPEGPWALFTFFGGPTGSRPFYGADPVGGLVLDPFRIDAIDRHLDALGGEIESRLGSFFETTLRSVFVDSLELRSELFWTSDLFQEFLARRGYRIEPFLPVLNRPFRHDAYASKIYPNAPPGFEMRLLGPRVRYDYDRTLAELMNERFFRPIREWAEARGLKARFQAHGGPVDLLSAYGEAHVPETEGLFAGGASSFLKMASSAAHIDGKDLVGSEVFAFRLGREPANPTAMLRQAHAQLAAGANQLVMHGFPYVRDEGFAWPGWMPFDSPHLPGRDLIGRFGTRLNDRSPFWEILPELNRYLGRAQLVGRFGKPRAAIALYSETSNYPDDPTFEPLVDPVLRGSGYDYDWVGDRALSEATTLDGRLRVGASSYQALVLPEVARMSLELAGKIRELVEGGVAVVFVGKVPSETPGYLNFLANDAELGTLLEEMFQRDLSAVADTTKTIAGRLAFVRAARDLPAVLAADLAVAPELQWGSEGVSLRYSHRSGETADYYFLYHSGEANLDIEVSFPDELGRVPEIWDLWSGVVSPAIVYVREAERTRVQLHFTPGSAVVVGFDRVGTEPHLETTSLTAVRRNLEGGLTAIVQAPGDYSVIYGGGILDGVSISGPTLSPIELQKWDLMTSMRGASGEEIVVRKAGVDLEDLSTLLGGFGATTTYTTLFDSSSVDPGYFSPGVGLILDLGTVFDVARVEVNGNSVGSLFTFPYTVEVTDYLVAGPNRIDVVVTTDPTLAPSGLLGPVQLVPVYKVDLSSPDPIQLSVNVVPPNFPNNTNDDMLRAIVGARSLVDHVSFQWFWKTPPNDANPEGGVAVQCDHVATWVREARRQGLGVTLQFQTFYTHVDGGYALDPPTPGRFPEVQVATPLMPFETATFAAPEVRDGYLQEVACLATLEPEYLVLGPEVNFVYVFDRPEWEVFLPVYRDAYRVIKAISPQTQVGLSYQYDGMLRDRELHKDDWGYIGAVGPADFIALTSYYGFSEERFLEFPEPYRIPHDYYRPIREVLGDEVPILFSEIGWSSFFEQGEVTQAEFIKRMPVLLRDVRPDHVIWALLHDVTYFEGPGQSLNQSGLLDSTGRAKPVWDAAVRLKQEAMLQGVVSRVYVPAPLPFSVTAAPPNFPIEPITIESGFAAISTAAELSSHVSFQFSWRDQVTGTVWQCDEIRPFVEEAKRRGLGVTLQFNTYTPVLSADLDAPPSIVFSNPIDPPAPPFDDDGSMKSVGPDAIREAYLAQVACVADLKPDFLVLGPEVNFLVLHRPAEFREFASVFREAYDRIRTTSPETRVGVSIQFDVLLEQLREGGIDHWMAELGSQDFVGLTTYFDSSDGRHQRFPDPLTIPDDYYNPARAVFGAEVPIVFTEVAWSTFYPGGLENQALFMGRLPILLHAVRPENVIWGLQHDILDYYSGEIRPLNHIGLRRLEGLPKPAWQRALELRARGVYRDP